MKKEQKLEQQPNSDSAADNSQVSPLAQNRLLSAALSVEEGNKLIAEFDGWKFMRMVSEFPLWQKFNKKGKVIHEGVFRLPEYHNNWNMLMSVIEKIEGLGYKTQIRTFDLSDWHFTLIRKGLSTFADKKSKVKIESTWLAIIEFIKWYNDNAASVGSR